MALFIAIFALFMVIWSQTQYFEGVPVICRMEIQVALESTRLPLHCGVDFQFSGHTHYGQVWPISWITNLMYECAWGLHARGETQYYVSSGIGIWGGKFRIGTRSECIVADLWSR